MSLEHWALIRALAKHSRLVCDFVVGAHAAAPAQVVLGVLGGHWGHVPPLHVALGMIALIEWLCAKFDSS